MLWYVHRRADGTIASAHEEPQTDYATEALDDATGELAAWFAAIRNPVPALVRNWQGRAVMETSTLADGRTYDAAVRTLISGLAPPQNTVVLAAYQSADFDRASPTINQLLSAIGLTELQKDDLFRQAGSLNL